MFVNINRAHGLLEGWSTFLACMFCFPISDHAIGSPENSFYPRTPVYMHYFFSDPLYRNSIPTLQHSTPTRRRVRVCWRDGEGDTPSYKLYNQVSLLDISLPNVSEFAYRLMKVEGGHIYLPQSYALYNVICFEIGYCNQSDGFISHISPGIVMNISGIQLVWNWTGVGIIIGFQ